MRFRINWMEYKYAGDCTAGIEIQELGFQSKWPFIAHKEGSEVTVFGSCTGWHCSTTGKEMPYWIRKALCDRWWLAKHRLGFRFGRIDFREVT